ncbi:MAG: hypothetical protein MRZ79_01735 [Bacteroidia bacterium]|nr:hypothetical protein [Bacteroidia bacterium]
MIHQAILKLFTLFFLGFILGRESEACICPERNQEETCERAAFIFQGTLVNVIDSVFPAPVCYTRPNGESFERQLSAIIYEFQVNVTFKGKPVSKAYIQGGNGWADCGIFGSKGDDMLIFAQTYLADNPENYPDSSHVPVYQYSQFCDGSGFIEWFSQEDIHYLNQKYNQSYLQTASLMQVRAQGQRILLIFIWPMLVGAAILLLRLGKNKNSRRIMKSGLFFLIKIQKRTSRTFFLREPAFLTAYVKKGLLVSIIYQKKSH